MSKYKVCVYAICKNEEQFVERFYNSMKEADEIYVLDTGSTDNTVKLLEEKGIHVITKIIEPWRFDVARNISLNQLPCDTDICVCVDLDEVFDSGWRQELENVWKDGTNRVRYIYNWSLNEKNEPIISFYYEKIHSRHNYKWIYPVHEVLQTDLGFENFVTCDKIVLNHYPDSNKSRGSYLSLLELSVLEDNTNDRNMHYLGREYMYYGRWQECIETLKKHLELYNATWKDERSASMRFIARSYINLVQLDEARKWYQLAIDEAPYLREGYIEMAFLEYYQENWLEAIKYCTLALTIKENKKTYINEVFSWNYTIDDLLSICYYELNIYDIALYYIDRALKYDNNNDRLINNRKIIYEKSKI